MKKVIVLCFVVLVIIVPAFLFTWGCGDTYYECPSDNCDEENVHSAEGSIASPVDIGVAPPSVTYNGQVDKTSSYYVITVTQGQDYVIYLTGMKVDLDLYVYSDSSFSNLLEGSSTVGTDDEIVGLGSVPVTNLYIEVRVYEGCSGSVFMLGVYRQA